MTSLPSFDWFAALLLDRILICLVEGTLLALAVTLLFRFVPKKNSQTRFAVWLATLIAIVILPLLRGEWRPHAPEHALMSISSAWAGYVVAFWAIAACVGLVRIAAGVRQLHRLRRSGRQLPCELLPPELQQAIHQLRRSRKVSILVSDRVEVPGAIGFLHPAIVLPPWIVEDLAAAELKYVILHELAHLQRWDDWSNLAQKVVKALLFFHPGVWWIERKLSLDREMACDETVLARAESARVYAQCLARVAERSFLRRQYALVQAAVNRVRQLSLRVASILDQDRPKTSRVWKPALPMVTVFAVLCAFSASWAPELVQLSDSSAIATRQGSSPTSTQAGRIADIAVIASNRRHRLTQENTNELARTKTCGGLVSITCDSGDHGDVGDSLFVPALYKEQKDGERSVKPHSSKRSLPPQRVRNLEAKLTAASDLIPRVSPETQAAETQRPDAGDTLVVLVTNQVVVSHQGGPEGPDIVQVHVWELRWVVPANPHRKPIPRKT